MTNEQTRGKSKGAQWVGFAVKDGRSRCVRKGELKRKARHTVKKFENK